MATHRRRCGRDCIPEWRCFLHSCMLAHEMAGAARDSLGSSCTRGVCLHILPAPHGGEVMTPTWGAISSDFHRRPRPNEPAVISTQGTPFRLARCKQALAKSPRKSPGKSDPASPPMMHPDLSQPTGGHRKPSANDSGNSFKASEKVSRREVYCSPLTRPAL